MSEVSEFDLIVIGGGPAGYVGAIRAAQMGKKVACIEKDKLGGVCLNWGCIPTKALIAGATLYHKVQHEAAEWGINVGDVSYDWEKVIGRSRDVSGQLNRGIGGLFKKNKVTHVAGSAKIIAQGKVEVTDGDGNLSHTLYAKNILIATGAKPRELPGAAFDGEKILSSKEAMVLKKQPKKLLVIGSGAIGMEFAYFYNAFGTEVTVVEMVDRVLPIEDDEVSATVQKSFEKSGVKILTGTKTMSIETNKKGIKAVVAKASDDSDQQTIEADQVLIAIGVTGRYEGLFDETLGIEIDRGHIKVNKENYQTSVPGIFAAGDIIGPPWLAHVGSEEAVVCVEKMFGHEAHPIDYDSIPGCTYCQPQVASFGKTERVLKEDGKKAGTDYNVGKFPFMASGKAQASGETEGFVKIISDAQYGEILGVHMVGSEVTELLAELGLAKRLEATVEEVIATMHAHPTLSESVHEAALGTLKRTLHF